MSDAINIVSKNDNLHATTTINESTAAAAGADTPSTNGTTALNITDEAKTLATNIVPTINNTNVAPLTITTPARVTTSAAEQSASMTLTVADVSNITEPRTSSNKTDITIDTKQPSTSATITHPLTTSVAMPTTIATSSNSVDNLERSCWICFATEEDNRLAAWVQPCKCRGTTKWVHQSCLYRWIDEKQKGNALRSVCCQQCQTEYIIVFPQIGKIANVLESFDNLIKRLSPFLAAGIFVGSLYWTAVTYGAVTFLQVVGHKKGLSLMENGDPLILLLGLPAIPVGLVLGRMIRWEDAVIRLIRNRRTVARKFPLMNFIIPYPDEEEEQSDQHPATPTLSDPVSATRIFCGALLLPTISSIVGRLLFESIDNTLHRTLLGGLTFITVKGILKIYLKQQQYTRKKKRRIIDYTEENLRTFVNRNTTASRYYVATAATPRQQQPAQAEVRQEQQQAQQVFDRDFIV